MRKVLMILLALSLLLVASPAFAQDMEMEYGTFSIGLGGAFGDEIDPGPIVISGKYWDPMWEIGADLYFAGEEESADYDQLGMVWVAYRYDLNVSEEGSTYVGIGGAGIFEEWDFENQFGPVGLVGWDSEVWGAELKYAYFDPSIISVVIYYHIDDQWGE